MGSIHDSCSEGASTGVHFCCIILLLVTRNQPTVFTMQVGQMQLIRRIIAQELATSSKFDSKLLASALSNLNGYS